MERFLSSVARQASAAWELVIVDQNLDNRLVSALSPCQDRFPILHLKSEAGLSRARNVGLQHITGDVVGFPDDDCWYTPHFLPLLSDWFEAHADIDGVSVISRDERGRPSNLRWDTRGGVMGRNNIWRRAISYTVFLRREVVTTVGEFDPELGVGSGTRWGSGEEADYLLRALNAGFRLYYEPSIAVCHSQANLERGAAVRGYSYGLGFGRVQRKHSVPFPTVLYYWTRSLAGAALSLTKLDHDMVSLHWGNLRGRVRGWIE